MGINDSSPNSLLLNKSNMMRRASIYNKKSNEMIIKQEMR